jgi:hypothetical protein
MIERLGNILKALWKVGHFKAGNLSRVGVRAASPRGLISKILGMGLCRALITDH